MILSGISFIKTLVIMTSKVNRAFLVLLVMYSLDIASLGQTATVVAKNAFPSVVMIQLHDANRKPTQLGSGFFVRPDVIATNFHVVSGGSSATVKQVGNPKIYQIEGIVGIDKVNDLALLKVKGLSGRPLPLADISRIEIGQDVYVLGNPQGLEGTISNGILSATGLRQIGQENLLQITAPISGGSSGGPVMNSRGEVIGITVSSARNGQNLNFAVPASFLSNLIAKSGALLSFEETFRGQEDSGRSSEPSFEETAKWISDTLVGRSFQYKKKLKITFRALSFTECSLTYVQDVQSSSGSTWRNQFKASMKDLIEVDEAAFHSDYAGSIVQLAFSPDAVTSYSTLDDSYDRNNNIKLPSGDSKLGQLVVAAFENLSRSCGKPTKK